jgi:diguanylate cyclase (GGDEF)-like protein/PAS domain S-box-containing protein
VAARAAFHTIAAPPTRHAKEALVRPAVRRFRRITTAPRSRRWAGFAGVALAGIATAAAVNLGHGYAQRERDASRHVVEVEAAAAEATTALSLHMEGARSLAQVRGDVADAETEVRTGVAALRTIDSGIAADLDRQWQSIDAHVTQAADDEAAGNYGAANRESATLDQLQADMAARADAARTRLIDASSRVDLLVALFTSAVIVGSLLVVAGAVWRTGRRRQRLAVVEAESEALRQSEETLRLLFDGSPQPMFAFSLDDLRVLAANRTALDFYGYTEEQMLAMTVGDLIADRDKALRPADDSEARLAPVSGLRVRHIRADGSEVEVEVHSRAVTLNGVAAKLTLVVDITERSALERELQRQALHDALTALPNRTLLLDRLQHALAHRDGGSAVLLLDLDGFKTVNDTLGHVAGDELLAMVAQRLSAAVRPGDTVARLGGDEFAVVLEGMSEPNDIHGICTRILDALREPVQLVGRDVTVTASIGVAIASGDNRSAEAVLVHADIAMYAAKGAGKGVYQVFSTAMQADLLDRVSLEEDLRQAIALGQLRLVYQPKVHAATGRVTAVEALVRWDHPTRGTVAPARFIPLAEELGIVADLDAWVLDSACAQLAAWDMAGLHLDHVAVNISGRELSEGGLVDRVFRALRRHELEGSRLELELTEGSAVQQHDEALAELARIRALGVSIAIDDFGTGYSILSRLQNFPLDRLKIDRSFVADIDGDGTAPLVVAMIGMGHELGLKVVAEGVETTDQMAFLQANGVDEVQGYLLSRPVDAGDVGRVAGEMGGMAASDAAMRRALQVAADIATGPLRGGRLVPVLLAELERLTGLETTYLTRIDPARQTQTVVEVHNVGDMAMVPGIVMPLAQTLCQRVMADGRSYVASVSETYPEIEAAAALGIETFVTVPLRDERGTVVGSLCGANPRRIDLPESVVGVMRLFAELIARAQETTELTGTAAPPVPAPGA